MLTSHRFGRCEILSEQRQLLVNGQPAVLGSRAFDLLLCLVELRDRVVGKDELMARVWPGVVVEENNLTVQISALRKVLGGDAIATVAGRGYRFTLPALDGAAGDSSPVVAPPLPSSTASTSLPNNLPTERSSFIGREQEISAVRRAVGHHRLVTLTGVGGSGKTRLALRVGALELGRFVDGTFFVDLGPLSDTELVSTAMASACGLLSEGLGLSGASTANRLVAALTRRTSLLIVDNCEHLLDAVATLVERIQTECPDICILATSREALGVEGEQVVPVPALGLPDDASPGPNEASDAVRLFVDRAQSVKPGFTLGTDNDAAVVAVCRHLDGIPLAIEFAAARVAHLSVQQIAERLEDRFRLLTGGRRRLQRQQTLAAALDWSHDLLSGDERAVFRRLAVFAGSFALAAAEAVCSADDIPKEQVLDLLGSLVAKSLVGAVEDGSSHVRYRLLETVRMYASEKLAAGGEAQALRTRHCDWYLAWLDATPLEHLVNDLATVADVGREIDNLHAAADWCEANDWPDRLARLASRMFGFWWLGGTSLVGLRWSQKALDAGERLAVAERIACLTTVAMISTVHLDNIVAMDHANRAIKLADAQPSPFVVMALNLRAFGQSVRAAVPGVDPQLAMKARADAERSIAMASAGMHPTWLAGAANLFGQVETNLGDIGAATRWYEEVSQTRHGSATSSIVLPLGLAGLSVTQHLLGHTETALRAALDYEACRTLTFRALPWFQAAAIEIAPALAAGGRQAHALALLREAEKVVRKLGLPLAENHLLCIAGVVEHLRGNPDRAARLLAASRRLAGPADRFIPFRTPGHWALHRHYQPLVRATLGAEQGMRAREEGQAMSMDEALAYAMQGLQ
jgi:predicted ATPase/DNA-binding winged helix-turn-helix (wHTH) protein